ncbi:AtpZ/AtpI family protein [Pirellulaceae bacterium]|jgi:ATP synthase protein I|nr:AtpZ/AtpI family protein [Pirellulaceae bacterium]MDB4631867.1 AtpZ/AtpI family protein [bacterium]
MSSKHRPNQSHGESLDEFERTVEKKGNRKIKSKLAGKQSPWFGLGMFGLVGWSVVLPTLFGVFLGTWIDNRWPGQVSWQLTLLFIGVFIGCANAWYWINKEIIS